MYRWGVELTPNQRRVPVTEAADALGISEGAVRMRVKRGTLPSTREGGRLYVLLEHDPTSDPERPHDRTSELIATLQEQPQAERAAHAEARRLLAAALERIPSQLEAPTETPEPETEESSAPEEPRRGFWSRLFGG